jgi:hypothetical protein
MSEPIYPAAGGMYEIDAKGALRQVEAPTQDSTYDRGAAVPAPEPVAPAKIVDNFIEK